MLLLNGRAFVTLRSSPSARRLAQPLCGQLSGARRLLVVASRAVQLSELNSSDKAGPRLDLSLAGPVLPPAEPQLGPRPAAAMPPFIVGVAGGTASGKTTVVQRIAEGLRQELLGAEDHVLSLEQDSWYRDLTPAEAADVASYSFDHPDAFSFPEMVACLRALKRWQPVQVPVYSYKANARQGSRKVLPAPIVLFDGILAFHDPELRSLFDLKLFVDVDADVRLARRIRRDTAQRGRDVARVLAQYERTVKPAHDAFVFPSRVEADVIVPRGADNEVAIELVLQLLRAKLAARRAAVAA